MLTCGAILGEPTSTHSAMFERQGVSVRTKRVYESAINVKKEELPSLAFFSLQK
jgi:hypothetical protein